MNIEQVGEVDGYPIYAESQNEADADAAALAEAITFDASEDVQGLTGTHLLRLVAMLLDKRDDETGNPNRTVQADLRRWADRIDHALAAHEARVKG
jgi:hypothetical protein